ncbi:MAG: hypothetical protein L3J24_14475 [Xanthomonadales bacterium]|nr:hypothetical protein [Xanthomonadales bacterium]
MLAFIALPTLVQDAVASQQHSTPLMEEVKVRGVRGRIQVCVGGACRLFTALPESLDFLTEVLELDVEDAIGLLQKIIIGFKSKDPSINCRTNEVARQGNAGHTIAGADFLWKPGRVALIQYGNGESELFRLAMKAGTLRYVPIYGSCG